MIKNNGNLDLINALPKAADVDPTGERLAQLIERIDNKKIPTSSFARFWSLGSLQAKVTLGYLAYWIKRGLSKTEERDQLKEQLQLETALQLFGSMGYMRGFIMKLGQLLASLPTVVPEEFAEVMEKLHFQAPSMHYAMVRDTFLNEFGKLPEDMFSSFDKEAFAAASLGQVHRARLHTGEEVAVKIQYPNIARTIVSDVRNLKLLLQPLRFGENWPILESMLNEIERMLLLETDYMQEAEYCRQALDLFEDDEDIVVPIVYETHSSKKILTMDFIEGVHLSEFLDNAPTQEERDSYCEKFFKCALRVYYEKHWYFADPHPGNFIFMPDGKLGLIDFGCTLEMPPEEWDRQTKLENAFLTNDRELFDRLLLDTIGLKSMDDITAEELEVAREYVYWLFSPWLKDEFYNFGEESFYQEGISRFIATVKHGPKTANPIYIWGNRCIFAHRGFLLRLKGRTNFVELANYERNRFVTT